MAPAAYPQGPQSSARPTPAPIPTPPNNTPKKPLWDPWEVLDLYPNNQTFTCVGIGRTTGGSRCGWHVFWDTPSAPAEADLEFMSTMQPSQVSRDRLITLAKRCLCAHNHQYQAANVAEDWSVRIAKYVKNVHGQVDFANELRDVKASLEKSEERLEKSEERLSNSDVRASEALREISTATSNLITSLKEQLTASTARISLIEDTNKAQTQVIEDLKQRCAVECDRTRVVNELYDRCAVECDRTRVVNELYDRCKKNNSRLRSENDTKEEKVKGLKKDVDSLRTELAESRKAEGSQGREIEDLRRRLVASDERVKAENDTNEGKVKGLRRDIETLETKLEESRENQRAKDKETDDLRRQLTASHERIKELQVTKDETIRLRQQIEEVNEALGKKDRQFSQLEQDHQRLKIQNRLRAFANYAMLSAKQKRNERIAQENSALSEQGHILNRRLEEADLQLAAQDRMISKFKLKNVHKGICAVFAVRPLRVSLRRFSKVGEVAA